MSEMNDLIKWDDTRIIPKRGDTTWHIYTNAKHQQLEVRRYMVNTHICIRVGRVYETVNNPAYDYQTMAWDQRFIKAPRSMQFGANNNFFCDMHFFSELLTVMAVAYQKADDLGWLVK